MQLEVAGRDWCDFFVYTRRGHFLERVQRDLQLTDELVESCCEFFAKYVAPEMIHAQLTPADVPSSVPATTLSQLPPAVTTAQKRRRSRAKRTVTARPVYFCNMCNKQCKEVGDMEEQDDQSVGCDQCQRWYHWNCVGFSGLQEDSQWYCLECETNEQ